MKLLTKELQNRIPALYATEETPLAEKIVQAKFFTPWSNWTWYVTEGNVVLADDRELPYADAVQLIDAGEKIEVTDWLFFGLVRGQEDEWGYFTLSELESVKGPVGLRVERDIHFHADKVADCTGGRLYGIEISWNKDPNW